MALAAIAPLTATASPKSAPVHGRFQHEATVEGVAAYRWPNGFRALLLPDHTRDTATVAVTYFVGSRDESYGQTGVAHLLEHLLFDATRSHPDLARELAAHGASWNAATGADSTLYYATIRAEDLRWALQLEADRMVNSVIDADRIRREVAVVRSELAIDEDHPATALTERLFSAAYTWHSYGRGVGGALSDLENVTAEDVKSFYRSYYRPDNALLAVTGRFDPAAALAGIDASFGALPLRRDRIPRSETVEPPQEGARTIELRRESDVHLLEVGYHIPAPAHDDFAPLQVLTGLLARSPGGPLHASVIHPRHGVEVYGYASFRRDPGLAIFGARLAPGGKEEAARQSMLAALETGGWVFPETDVETERQRAANDMNEALRSTERFALEIGDWAAMGDWRLFFLHCDRLKRVTAADVQRVAGRYLQATNRTVAELVPTPAATAVVMPPAANAASLVRDYVSQATFAAGEAFNPSPPNIESRIVRTRVGPGLNAALLPKRTRGAQVHAVLTLRFGDAESLENRLWAGHLTGRMLLRGTRQHTRQQIQDEFTRAGAEVHLYSGADHVSVSIAAGRAEFARVFRLAAEALRYPSFPEAEFDELKRAALVSAATEKSDPDAASWNVINRMLHPYPAGDIRRASTPAEKIEGLKSVSLSAVRAFHADFYGASHGELAVVGDFDPDDVRQLANECFDGWRSLRPYQRVAREYQNVEPMEFRVNQPGRRNAAFRAGLALPIDQNSPDYAPILVASHIMGGGFLSSRLPSRIRKDDGLSYWIESRLYGGALDPALTFITSAASEPSQLAPLKAAFSDELERSVDEGFSSGEVEAAKLAWQRQRQVELADDGRLVWELSSDLYAGRARHWHATLEQRIASLTAEEVTAAWRKYIDPSAIAMVEAGDLQLSQPAADVN